MRTETTSSSTTIYVEIPQGPLIRGRVKVFDAGFPNEVHAGKPHKWHEMLHDGQRGTGFAQCRCGAMAIPYRDRGRRH